VFLTDVKLRSGSYPLDPLNQPTGASPSSPPRNEAKSLLPNKVPKAVERARLGRLGLCVAVCRSRLRPLLCAGLFLGNLPDSSTDRLLSARCVVLYEPGGLCVHRVSRSPSILCFPVAVTGKQSACPCSMRGAS